MGNGAVGWVILEELCFALESISHGLVDLNISLTSVDNSNKSELERVGSSGKNVERVSSCVHEIQLCQDTDGALCLRIDLTSKLKTV